MLMGRLLYRKRYRTLEYVSALAIGTGVGCFALVSSSTARGAVHDAQPLIGYSLVAVNLIFDALTNTGQDEVNRAYPRNTSLHMMTWTNFWGALYYGLYLFGISHSGREVLTFCSEHRQALVHLLQFCLCGALGQLVIFYTISSFGSLVNSLVCTTRKFFSILISVVLAGSSLTGGQWGAVALVFGGLMYKSLIRLVPSWSKRKTQ
jgi:solute carrier family 35 (UDP-galactose transporter), member B1